MKDVEITIVDADDWSGLYVNGELRDEGHSLRVSDVLEILGYKVTWKECDGDWMDEHGTLPNKLSEVKFYGE